MSTARRSVVACRSRFANKLLSLTPGQAALCVLVRKVTADKVLPAMAAFGGKVLHTNLTTEQEAKLQEALKA